MVYRITGQVPGLVWSRLLVWIMDMRLRYTWVLQEAITGLCGGAGIPGHWCSTWKLKKFKLPDKLEKEYNLSSCFNLHNVNNFNSLVKMTPLMYLLLWHQWEIREISNKILRLLAREIALTYILRCVSVWVFLILIFKCQKWFSLCRCDI